MSAESGSQEEIPQEREDEPGENNEEDPQEQLAALAENPSDVQNSFTEVSNEDMEDDDLLLDESLSPLEKIFLFAKSDAIFHRVFIAKELPQLLRDVEITEAVEYVLPLMNSLGTDPDDAVREAFAPELDKIIWFYYSHCPLKELSSDIAPEKEIFPPRPQTPNRPPTPRERPPTPRDRPQTPQRPQTPKPEVVIPPPRSQTPTNYIPHISPQAFTPLLHALLLDQNTSIATSAQNVVLSLVEKILEDSELTPRDKELLERETLEGVVLGIGRLDQERQRREENGEWDNDNDDQSISGVAGSEEEAELGRMTMMSLISSLANIVGPERATRLFVPELDRLADEPVFYVRKEAAMAVGGLAGVVPLDVIISKLLPIYDLFSTDPIWHVRRSCCLVLPIICGRLPQEMKPDRAQKGIDLFAGDVSRSVRSAAGEIIGELIATFQPGDDVPEGLVQHFLSLGPGRDGPVNGASVAGSNYGGLSQRDPERPVICAYNFPAVVLTLGPSRWDDLKETYASLTRDMQIKVRRSLACSLHEIAKVIGPEKTEQDLLSVFAFYLIDLDEVKSGLMEHLAAFIECLPQNTRNEYLPSLNDVWDGVKHQWRLRDEIAKQLSALCRSFDEQSVINHILPLAIRAVKDTVSSVRETAVASFPTLFGVVRNDEASYKELINQVKQFATDTGFRGRVVYVQICTALIFNNCINKAEFEEVFLPALQSLASDRVINVRIAVARLIGELCKTETWYADPLSRPQIIVDMIRQLADDTDVDVQGFVCTLLPPGERPRSISTPPKTAINNVANGLSSIKPEDGCDSTKSKQDPIDMAIDDEASNTIMIEIPIALIGRSDSMEVDPEDDNTRLSDTPSSPPLSPDASASNNIKQLLDTSTNLDIIPILLGSEAQKMSQANDNSGQLEATIPMDSDESKPDNTDLKPDIALSPQEPNEAPASKAPNEASISKEPDTQTDIMGFKMLTDNISPIEQGLF